MAQPSIEVQRFRQRVTALADDLAEVGHQAAGEPTTDITLREFLEAYGALSGLLGAVTPEARAAIGKLRI